MKHFYIMMAMLTGCAGASAQTLGDETTFEDYLSSFIPSRFTTDKRVKVLSYLEENESNAQIKIYDDFKEVKSFNVTQSNSKGYTITREREAVNSIIKISSYRRDLNYYGYKSLDDFKKDNQGRYEIEISGGDSVVFMESTSFYFDFDKYGTKYPSRYFVYYLKTNDIYDVTNYYEESKTYTGAWVESKEDAYSQEEDIAIPLYFNDYDADKTGYYYRMQATQTLFNDDSKYEYLRYKYEIKEGTPRSYDRDHDGEIDKEETTYRSVIKGFELVSEDGTILQSINFDRTFYFPSENAKTFKMNGNYYVSFPYFYDDEDGKRKYFTYIYAINPSTTSIQKVDIPQGLAVRPSLADRSTTISVETPAAQSDRRVIVTNAAGQTVWDTTIQAGQTNVQIDARHLSRGVNVVNVEGDSKHNNSCKVIVK